MGNHDVGRGMAAAARAVKVTFDSITQTGCLTGTGYKIPALDILDAMVDAGNWRGSDAEFDDHLNPGETLGQLVCEAFAPGETFPDELDDDDDYERWREKVYDPFNKRYRFC